MMPRLCQMSVQLKNHLAFSHPQKEGNLSSGVNQGSDVFIYFYGGNSVLINMLLLCHYVSWTVNPVLFFLMMRNMGHVIFFSPPRLWSVCLCGCKKMTFPSESFLMAVIQECRTHQWCVSQASGHQHLLLTTRVVQVGYLQFSCTFSQHEGGNRSM